ncbi:MAG: tetratricopeptide repeat protein [Limisphaerales bacterium]
MAAPDSDSSSPDGGSRREADDVLPPRWQAASRWAAPVLTLAALALIALNCVFNPNIRFLTPGPGKWIVFPLPPEVHSYPAFALRGTFRRNFALPENPASASLSWRCMTNGEVRVNGAVVPPSGSSSGNWKTTSHAQIGPLLRAGTNEVSVTVVNRLGPPALSLKLRAGDLRLSSDETWEVSVSGSDWRPARAASATPRPGKGNPLGNLETTSGSLGRCWPWLCVFAVISVCGVALVEYYGGRFISSPPWRRGRRDWLQQLQYYVARIIASSPSAFYKWILAVLAVAWVLLFLHNFPLMPIVSGFDAPEHLAYVNSIQDYRMEPSAAEGFEAFQPPLYYLISATLLDLADSNVSQPLGMMLLRILSLVIGAATLALVFAGLRLIFPGDWKKPLAGLALAAFLPANICLLHNTTNETLSAMFVTAALCVCLHLLQGARVWWGWYGVLGLMLGLALSSKASAVLAVLATLGVLAVKLMQRRQSSLRIWVGCIGIPLLVCLLVGGWHYIKLWGDYGSPFIGNWDPKVAAPWWQAKGFQTPGYFFCFGDALSRPFFSGLHSFWDGFYSTLWGDGLLGGHENVWSRPPWNYDFMAVGFVLALVPTALVLTGLFRAIVRSFREGNLIRLLLNGLGWLFAFAILAMSLKVPSYAQIKAFYGLPVLLPFCAMGALGFEFWAGRGRVTRYILGVAFGIWLLNVYASFWIKPGTAQTELASADIASLDFRWDPTGAMWKMEHYYSDNSQAMIWLAQEESKKDPEQAVKRLEQALKHDPFNGEIEIYLARDLTLCDRLDEAIVHAKRAVDLAPEDEIVAQTWCSLALRRKDYQEAVTAGRAALSVTPANLQTRFDLGVALMSLRQMPEAISQFSALVDAKPAWAEPCFALGICLLDQPGKRDDGLAFLKEAVRLTPTNAVWQAALQKALKGR